MRSASKASATASISRVEPSSTPTSESPSIVRWDSRIPKEGRMYRDSLRIKVKLLLLEGFGDDFEPRPFQSLVSQPMCQTSTDGHALSIQQAAKLCMRGKIAVVVSKKTWEDGKLYEQPKDSLCKVEYIFIVSFKTL